MKKEIEDIIKDNIKTSEKLLSLNKEIEQASAVIIEAYKRGNKVLAFGNGGSAGDAQHFIAELVGKFKRNRKARPGLALTTNTSILTAVANDYGYDKVFSRQLEGNAVKGDVVVGISTSGNSPNVTEALKTSKKIGCKTIGLIGKNGGPMKEHCDIAIIVPSDDTARIQEKHITIIHIICELVEREFYDE